MLGRCSRGTIFKICSRVSSSFPSSQPEYLDVEQVLLPRSDGSKAAARIVAAPCACVFNGTLARISDTSSCGIWRHKSVSMTAHGQNILPIQSYKQEQDVLPGLTEIAVMPLPTDWLNATACRATAALDCPYAMRGE